MKKLLSRIAALTLIAAMLFTFSACKNNPAEEASAVRTAVNVITLKGPAGMGMAKLMSDNENGTTANDYTFTIDSAPDEVTAEIIKGNFDIATVPVNLAAVLYKKTNGALKIAALNSLGVLYMLENGNTINSVSDLKGKTIYATGQGATPEYILDYILTENGLNPDTDVTVQYVTENDELATKMISGEAKIAMLPEPIVSTVLAKNSDIHIALDLTEEWNNTSAGKGTLVQTAVVVNKTFAENNKEALDKFLDEYKASSDYTVNSVDAAADLIVQYGIIASKAIAVSAIPNCNICYIDGDEMKTKADTMFNILYKANSASVGGELPGEDIYYEK